MSSPDPQLEDAIGNLTPEQRALLGNAASTDSSVAAITNEFDENGEPLPPPAPPVDKTAQAMERNVQLLNMALTMLAPVAPYLAECYPPQTVNAIAGAFTAVEIKRGWNVDKFMSEEFVLAVVALPPTIMAIAKGRAHIALMREQQTKPNPETMPTHLPGALDGQQ